MFGYPSAFVYSGSSEAPTESRRFSHWSDHGSILCVRVLASAVGTGLQCVYIGPQGKSKPFLPPDSPSLSLTYQSQHAETGRLHLAY